MCIVIGSYDQTVRTAGLHQAGDIEFKGAHASPVPSGEFAVNKHIRLVVYAAEVKDYTSTIPGGRYFNNTLIPHTADEVGIRYSGKFTLRTKWNIDFFAETVGFLKIAFEPRITKVKIETPDAVEIYPVITFKLRTWMLRPWNIHFFNFHLNSIL